MDETNSLAARFAASRCHLTAVAQRMLGSASDAEDAVQEAWLRLSRSDVTDVQNLSGWLTTTVSRICLDVLRARKARREDALDGQHGDSAVAPQDANALADSIGVALLVVLDQLAPTERVAFVLHDMFDLSFEEIAPIVGRSLAATRQLASRARRRVRGASPSEDPDRARQREVVEAFLAASRGGDLNGLLAVLAPNVVFRADARAAALGGDAELHGAAAVAAAFKGRAQAAKTAAIDGGFGLAVILGGQLRIALGITVVDGVIVEIDAIAEPGALAGLQLKVLD